MKSQERLQYILFKLVTPKWIGPRCRSTLCILLFMEPFLNIPVLNKKNGCLPGISENSIDHGERGIYDLSTPWCITNKRRAIQME